MASRSTRPNGDTWVFIKAANGKRRAVRLGRLAVADAEEAERRLEKIEGAYHGVDKLDRVTIAWLEELPSVLRARVARTGLLPGDVVDPAPAPHYPAPAISVRDCSLARLLEKWRATLTTEPQTVANYERHADRIRRFVAWLGEQKGETRRPVEDIRQLVPADGNRFEAWLIEHGRKKSNRPLSHSTASRTIGSAQTIFEFAVLEGWISRNPFEHLTRRGEFNEGRDVYVTPQLVEHLISIGGDDEFSACLALCRFAGFRGPSEFEPLVWADIDWEASMISITSPKTKRYRFGRRRRAPLDARCLKQLNKLWDGLPDKALRVLPRLGAMGSSQLCDRLEALCRRAGVPLWDKPWTNMRASCETDWQVVEKMQPFETAAYMGHSATVALLHYNRVAKDRVADLPTDPAKAKRSTSPSPAQGEAESEALEGARGGARKRSKALESARSRRLK